MVWKLGFEVFGNWDFWNFGNRDFNFKYLDRGILGIGFLEIVINESFGI